MNILARLDNLKSFQNVYECVYIPPPPYGHLPTRTRLRDTRTPAQAHKCLTILTSLHKPLKLSRAQANKMLDIPQST